MKALQKETIVTEDMELVPTPKTLKIQEGTIGAIKYDKTHLLSFMNNGKFIDIVLGEDEMNTLAAYFKTYNFQRRYVVIDK